MVHTPTFARKQRIQINIFASRLPLHVANLSAECTDGVWLLTCCTCSAMCDC